MRILVTGSRDWADCGAVYRALNWACDSYRLNYRPDQYGNTMPDPSKVTVVHGHCPTGADFIADEWCVSAFMEAERHPADWERYGKGAGFRRNAEMVNSGVDLTLAFILNDSKGATHTTQLAQKAGVRTIVQRRTCGPVPETWFTRAMWPTCACGLDPRDNYLLTQHWRKHGFAVVEDQGRLKKVAIK